MLLPISMWVIKQALLTGVDPLSDTALISAPRFNNNCIIGKLPTTAAHHRGVTQ